MRRAALAGAAALFLLTGLGGCGSGGEDAPAAGKSETAGGVVDISGTDPVGSELAGSVAALVTCGDWKGANEKQRLATIADIRAQLGPQDSGIEIPELTDEEAAEVFDGSCRPAWASGFRLYKLYAHAVGFVPLKRRIEAASGQ